MKIWGGIILAAAVLALEISTGVSVFSAPATNELDSLGNTPLHRAVLESGGLNVAKIRGLLDSGADVNATNYAGQTPLYLAVVKVPFWSYGAGGNGVGEAL